MAFPRNRHGRDVRIAYPWQVDAVMPDDVTGMGIDESIYSQEPLIGTFVIGRDVIGDGGITPPTSVFILDASQLDVDTLAAN